VKCPQCGCAEACCSACGGRLESSQEAYQRRMREQGRCIGCGHDLDPATDINRRTNELYRKCRQCRVAESGITTRYRKNQHLTHVKVNATPLPR
jgi:hypothetical protein